MSGHLSSEGVYEDVGDFPMGEKDEGPAASADLGLEEDYDDGGEPEDGAGEEAEEASVLLSPAGVHLCALASTVLFLLYCSDAEGTALASAYIERTESCCSCVRDFLSCLRPEAVGLLAVLSKLHLPVGRCGLREVVGPYLGYFGSCAVSFQHLVPVGCRRGLGQPRSL